MLNVIRICVGVNLVCASCALESGNLTLVLLNLTIAAYNFFFVIRGVYGVKW